MKIIMILFFLFLIHGHVAADEIEVGVYVHSHIVFNDPITNEVYGPGVDFIKAVIQEMGHTAKVRVLPISRIIYYLKTGLIDMALEFGKTTDRMAFMYYSDLPVLIAKPALAVLKENKLNKINSIGDLNGMTIGYLLGAFAGNFFANSQAVKFDLVSGRNWLKMNLNKLSMGRIDAVLDQSSYALTFGAITMGIEEKIKVLVLPVDEVKGYAVFSKKSPNSTVWLQQFNAINNTGKYNENRIIEDYFKELSHGMIAD